MSQIKKELQRFFLAGISAVTIDFVTYYFLSTFFTHDTAKTISFLLGTIVAFIINKYWTFEKHETSYKEMLQFMLLYGVTLAANVITNKIILEHTGLIFVAFLAATGVSTALNFIGQKWWVFK